MLADVSTAFAGSRPRRRIRIAGLLVWAALVVGAVDAAQGAASPIESVRKSFGGATTQDNSQSEAAIAQASAAADAETAELAKQLTALKSEAATQPVRIEQLRRALSLDRDKALKNWTSRLPKNADAETLERVLEQERSIIAGIAAQIDSVAGELALLLSGPLQAPSDIAELRQRSEELAIPLPRVEGEPAGLAEARRVNRASELRRYQTELELRLLEQETATRRQSLYELTISELRHRQGLHVARADVLQATIADLGRREIDSLIAKQAKRELELAGSSGLLAQTNAENRALGEELLEANERLSGDRNALTANEQSRDGTAISLRDSRARLELGGSNEQVGRWLWSERRRLEATGELERRLDDVRTALADARLRLVSLTEQSRALIDVAQAARTMSAAALEREDEEAGENVSPEALQPLLQDRAELLAILEPLYQRRIAALEQSEQALRGQIGDSRTLKQLLDRHLLWIASHRPIDASWFARIPAGFDDLVKGSRFTTTLELARMEFGARPLLWLASLVLLVVLIELRRRAPGRIESEAPVTRQIRRDTYHATARTLAWTLVAAAPLPAGVYLLAEFLQVAGEPGRFSDSLGGALKTITGALLAVQILRWTVMEWGLGHAHFRWARSRRETLRKLLAPTALVVLPMSFITALAFNRNLDLSNDVQARIAIVIAGLALAWSLWRLLEAGRIWVVRGVELEPSKLRRILRVALPLGALAIAWLAVFGWVYSAGLVLRAVLATFTMIVAIGILIGLLGRWLLLGERRLAYRRREERLAAAEAAGEQGDPAPELEPELTLEQINAQTGRLLKMLQLALIATGLVWVWAGLLPAFARLDEIALWHFNDTGPDGSEVQQSVTLMALLLGAAALALTSAAARNLPGLIEIGLLSKTHIDAPSRYAITSLLRYAIVIAGTVVGLGLLGLRWSQLQWMAAALTVGLGFGLQEIFANFVSGLILLFERPFRVGDVITVGELSGRVTKIRTRATTILDFENKEIVVPNKSFITGQLVNWTLSDTTTRITIKVGIDYGTDPGKVLDLLRQAARDNPAVLLDPEPLAWFIAFGPNSLDFELRVFVANLADRLIVQNGLNVRVAELFAENGISIAFPQLDVHIRQLPPGFGPNPPPTPA